MSIAFTRTREQLCTMILAKLSAIAAGETASAEDVAVVYEAIDLRLKELHRMGIFWRKVDKVPLSFTIPANTVSASATADILFPISMKVTVNSQDDPVTIIGIKEWASIADKTYQGDPVKCLWKGGSEFLFWPIPTTSRTAKLTYEKIVDDTAANTAPDVEVSMLRWLKDIIAYDLGDEFGVPEAKMRRWLPEAERAERNIRRLGVQRTDYTTVTVDDFDDWQPQSRPESDYER
jgi:hypothetical protein